MIENYLNKVGVEVGQVQNYYEPGSKKTEEELEGVRNELGENLVVLESDEVIRLMGDLSTLHDNVKIN